MSQGAKCNNCKVQYISSYGPPPGGYIDGKWVCKSCCEYLHRQSIEERLTKLEKELSDLKQ